MNSMISLILGNDAAFDEAVHGDGAIPDNGDLKLITKDKGTEEGNPIACLTFTVQVDGKPYRAQTVLTVRTLQCALAGLRGRYGDV